jgi:hypothetical protein
MQEQRYLDMCTQPLVLLRQRASFSCLSAWDIGVQWREENPLCLSSQYTLCLRTMPLSFTILLKCVLHRNLLSTQELSIHILNRHIRRFEVVVRNETISL